MTVIYVDRESHTSDSRLITPTVQLRDNKQVIAGADQPLIVRDGGIQDVIDGKAFYAYKLYKSASKLANNASINIVITAAVNKSLGVGFIASCGGDAEVTIYENSTSVTGGTLFVPLNRNRASTAISTTGILIDPTIGTLGTVIYESLVFGGTDSGGGGGGGSKAAGATARGDYALLDDVSYTFRLTNTSGSSQQAELMVQWIE
jgi:hypothetical protein